MNLFSNIYRDRRVLITGHTGFKGSWLSLWLEKLGAHVSGLALEPESSPNHWDSIKLLMPSVICDIRDAYRIQSALQDSSPEIVFHLAAQPLVRKSYADPLGTWSTNVMGTANLLEACRSTPSVRAIVIITTDKCYQNQEWPWGYREIDRLGGIDPYSASKAAVEVLAESYRDGLFNQDSSPLLATARAGNVIGGGDWSIDRLIPDLVRAIQKKHSLEIRLPQATRPWQHVLESLSGYLMLGERLLMGDRDFAQAWNFGPDQDGNCSVSEVLDLFNREWDGLCWHTTKNQQPYEAKFLFLDSSKAKKRLGWQSIWNLENSIHKTSTWYQAWLKHREIISKRQLDEYIASAIKLNARWVSK